MSSKNSRVRNMLRMKKANKRKARENRCKANRAEGSHNSNPKSEMNNSILNQGGNAWFIHSIGRAVVEAQDITALETDVRRLFLYSSDQAKRAKGRVTFIFEGWKEDKREVYDIPEIRKFISAMVKKIPIFFLCDDLTLLMASNSSCVVKKVGSVNGLDILNVDQGIPEYDEFIKNGIHLLADCYAQYGFTVEHFNKRMHDLIDLFQGKRRWDKAA